MTVLRTVCKFSIKSYEALREFVGNKTKGRISKTVSRKQSTPNFPKNKHLFPPDTHSFGTNLLKKHHRSCLIGSQTHLWIPVCMRFAKV